MPWEVALACNVQSDQSDDVEEKKKSCDHDLYVMYLSRLLGNKDSNIHEEIVKEMFWNDSELLLISLRVVLEGEGEGQRILTVWFMPVLGTLYSRSIVKTSVSCPKHCSRPGHPIIHSL